MSRAPTAPAVPTAEHNALLIESLQRDLEELRSDKEDLEEVVKALHSRMIAVCGEDGKGGKLGDLADKHDKSAQSQGGRLEKHTADLAVLMGDRRILQVLGAIALLALGVLLKTLIDRADPKPPEPAPPPPASSLLLRQEPWSFAFAELTPEPSRGDDAG